MQEQKKKNNERESTGKKAGGILSAFIKLDIKKKIQYAAILLVIIVILTIYFASSGTNTPAQTQENPADISALPDSIEAKLRQTLSNIQGAGRVDVMITYESTSEIVPAISVDTQTSTTTDTGENGDSTTNTQNTQSEIVTVNGNGGSSALVLRENSPEVKGVLVIAEGADDIGVKLSLLNAVKTILNVSPDKVDVYKMNNE